MIGPLPAVVRLSTLLHAYDKHPTVTECRWSDVLELLSADAYTFRAEKLRGPLFSPAEFTADETGQTRKTKAHVRAVWFGVLDFDDVTPTAFMATCAKAEPFAACAYTTWGQPEAGKAGLFRARLVVPFTRAALPAEWPALYARLVAFFGSTGTDESCKDASRCYFTPALPVGCEWAIQTWRGTGTGAWDVDSALAGALDSAPTTAGASAPADVGGFIAADPITRDQVARLADRLAKRADPNANRMGGLIKQALEGYAFANPGAHDNTIYAIACTLGEHFTHVDASALADLFRPALSLMAAQSSHPDRPAATVENLAEKITRAQKTVYEQRRATQDATALTRSRKIALAFLGKRSHPYTQDELKEYAAQVSGADSAGGLAALDYRWIVQRGNGAYLFFCGSYVGPFLKAELSVAAAQFLSPAIGAGVELYEVDDKGNTSLKSADRLVSEYGRVVERVEADLTAARSYLRDDAHVFVEAPCPLRKDLTPAYDPEVAEWLSLLAGRAPGASDGGKVEALLDWLGAVTMLQSPAPALYLKGEPGSGKSLIAFGLARLWGANHPTTMRAALGKFNDSILRCPLVLADEKVPETWSGQPRTEELRELITTAEFSVERKFQPELTARGSVRAICAANNLNMITTRASDLTPEDALALADRFLFVCPHPYARVWLQERTEAYTKAGGGSFGESLVSGDRIARHALWLREQGRPFKRGGRLIVPGDSDELVRLIQTGSGTPWAVLSWIWAFLQDPARHVSARSGRSFAALVHEGHVWIHARSLLDSWDHYLQSDRPPTLERLTSALRALLIPANQARYQPRTRAASGGRERYQALRLEQLAAWCTGQGEDASALHAGPGGLLERDTEQIATTEAPKPFSTAN